MLDESDILGWPPLDFTLLTRIMKMFLESSFVISVTTHDKSPLTLLTVLYDVHDVVILTLREEDVETGRWHITTVVLTLEKIDLIKSDVLPV